MSFLRFFISIVCGALASSVIGGIFACVVAFVSPEFVSSLFGREVRGSLVRYAAGVGMIWGIFLGTAAMAFSLLLVTLIHIARVLKKKSDEQNPS
jgi:ABC-type branched-subunit amino acid transport system permease subunit